MLIKQNMVDLMINDNTASMSYNVKYRDPVRVRGIPVVKQKESAGYACIEMMSEFLGDGSFTIDEELLSEKNNGRNTTSTNSGFLIELQKQFPDYKITQHKNLKNSEILDKIHASLKNNMPVIFSYAAQIDETDETGEEIVSVSIMHYGIITEIDIPGDKISFINPHGYSETYNIGNFLRATRFETYENMEFYLKIGFAIEIFAKNTIYIFDSEAGGESEESEIMAVD